MQNRRDSSAFFGQTEAGTKRERERVTSKKRSEKCNYENTPVPLCTPRYKSHEKHFENSE